MASRQNGGSSAPTPATPVDVATELSRRQLPVLVQGSCALFRAFEHIRGIQARTAQQALAAHEDAADRLARPQTMAELLAVQGSLLRFDLQGAADYWQQLAATVLQMQRELLGSVTAAEGRIVQDSARSLPEFTAFMPGFGALFQPPVQAGGGAQRQGH